MKHNKASARDRIVQFLHNELVGPRHGEEEIVQEAPYRRYTSGTLYPQDADTAVILAEDEAEISGQPSTTSEGGLVEEQGDDPVSLSNQRMPSSCGISFIVRNKPTINIEITAAIYESTDNKDEYRRVPLHSRLEDLEPENPHSSYTSKKVNIFENHAYLSVIWRRMDHGWLITVTVINNMTKNGWGIDPEKCLHQARFRCTPTEGSAIPAYKQDSLLTTDQEEKILEVLYRDQVSYGVGHGCSVDWTEKEPGAAEEIRNEYLPEHEISPISYDLEGDIDEVLSLYYLAEGENHTEELISKLRKFLDDYLKWIEDQPANNADIPSRLHDVRDLLIGRMENAAARIKKGIEVLEHHGEVRKAFFLANRAMLLQYIHSLDDYAGELNYSYQDEYSDPSLEDYRDRKWRPFQLAFQLLLISSVAFPEDPDRDIVDLIWFPTGGGKTEAYLAVVAFQIFYRRMKHGSLGYGTTVIMRYTLRLLTTQQFQRAATLLCACELIRRENPVLGGKEISIGLWVGQSSAPNTFQKAFELYEKVLEEKKPRSPYQVDRCPWCGTAIVPEKQTDNLKIYGIQSTKNNFSLYCPKETCPFHEKLPVGAVDEQLYESPPTMIIATVDKFARMTWVEEAGVFFGGKTRRPPELIIQDELHLISGPLGTMVGLYETAIDELITQGGSKPKILASTATIRNADEQIDGLYARSVEVFPPSGLRSDDSYFARSNPGATGRLYVGFMGQGHTGSTSMIRVSAALLQATVELELEKDEIDPYWTLVAYHNSLRELGKTLTFARDDIPARMKVIATDESYVRDIEGDKVRELTSNTADNLTEMLDLLEREYDRDGSISFLACSNMLSVGIDIQRLGLMLVNGQPKSTSEYIQSTSRVGRGVDGLVFCLLSPTKPRDRSHYERFVTYHSALYRFVEPSSVTPFSAPARDRALHAVLVSLVRHLIGLDENSEAENFDSDVPGLNSIIQDILSRIEEVDPEEKEAAEEQLRRYVSEWELRSNNEKALKYVSYNRQIPSLLSDPGQEGAGWDTLHSMRNVDKGCLIRIIDKF